MKILRYVVISLMLAAAISVAVIGLVSTWNVDSRDYADSLVRRMVSGWDPLELEAMQGGRQYVTDEDREGMKLIIVVGESLGTPLHIGDPHGNIIFDFSYSAGISVNAEYSIEVEFAKGSAVVRVELTRDAESESVWRLAGLMLDNIKIFDGRDDSSEIEAF